MGRCIGDAENTGTENVRSEKKLHALSDCTNVKATNLVQIPVREVVYI